MTLFKDIFLSHLGDDGDFAEKVAQRIEQTDLTAYYFERDSGAWRNHLDYSADAIDHAKAVIIVISPSILRRDKLNYVEFEMDYAILRHKTILYIQKDIKFDEIPRKYRIRIGNQVPFVVKESDPTALEQITDILCEVIGNISETGPASSGSGATQESQLLPPISDPLLFLFFQGTGLSENQIDKAAKQILVQTIAYGCNDIKTGTRHLLLVLAQVEQLGLKRFLVDRGYPLEKVLLLLQDESQRALSDDILTTFPSPSENLLTLLHRCFKDVEERNGLITAKDLLIGLLSANGYSVGSIIQEEFGIVLLDLLDTVNGVGGKTGTGGSPQSGFIFSPEGTIEPSRFDARSAHLLERAVKDASNFGHRLIGRRHLLYALLNEKGGELPRRLTEQGLDVDDLKMAFGGPKVMPVSSVAHTELALNTRAMSTDLARVLISAGWAATRDSDGVITAHHLLDALFEDPDDHLVKVLLARGFRWN